MNTADGGKNCLVGLGPASLHTLRGALERSLGEHAASLLQETGCASGPEVYQAFAAWLQTRANVADPADLDKTFLAQMMSEFFEATGWGDVELEHLGDTVLALDTSGWAEANSDTTALAPSCHFTTGMLAAFMTELAGDAVAVMEVECLTCGGERCRFLMGSAATLHKVFEAIVRGENYGDVLAGASAAI